MTCTCSTPNQSCKNARERIGGYYCSLTLPKTEPEQLRNLRHGQQFSFQNTEWNTHKVIDVYPDYILYQRHDGWKIRCYELDRIVNLIL